MITTFPVSHFIVTFRQSKSRGKTSFASAFGYALRHTEAVAPSPACRRIELQNECARPLRKKMGENGIIFKESGESDHLFMTLTRASPHHSNKAAPKKNESTCLMLRQFLLLLFCGWTFRGASSSVGTICDHVIIIFKIIARFSPSFFYASEI